MIFKTGFYKNYRLKMEHRLKWYKGLNHTWFEDHTDIMDTIEWYYRIFKIMVLSPLIKNYGCSGEADYRNLYSSNVGMWLAKIDRKYLGT